VRSPRTALAWLDRPLSAWWCLLGWVSSTLVFVGLVQAMGGPTYADAEESAVSTWSIAHGQLACAFPPKQDLAAPLYPFVSGMIAAAARIGQATAFPTRAALGPGCTKTAGSVWTWGWAAGALDDTTRIGYVAWLVLLAGVVALLRAAGRGRRGWEPATLLVLACLPPVWLCLENFFHPQDLLALGLVLGALACVLRDRWAWAGALIALALLSQQFALLVAVPLVVVAPPGRRRAYLGAAVGTMGLALVALWGSASTSAVTTALVGTGDPSGWGGTWLAALHPGVHALGFVSRVVPLELSLVLAWWAASRLGAAVVRQPALLISLCTLSLSLRLAFEASLIGYYFMALAVMLVLLDVVCGRFRAGVVAYLVAVSVTFVVGPSTSFLAWPANWASSEGLVAPGVLVVLALALGSHAARHGFRRSDLVWAALAASVLLAWWTPPGVHVTRVWWQVAFAGLGLALAAGPLLAALAPARSARRPVAPLLSNSVS
jgi:hypothetical protein